MNPGAVGEPAIAGRAGSAVRRMRRVFFLGRVQPRARQEYSGVFHAGRVEHIGAGARDRLAAAPPPAALAAPISAAPGTTATPTATAPGERIPTSTREPQLRHSPQHSPFYTTAAVGGQYGTWDEGGGQQAQQQPSQWRPPAIKYDDILGWLRPLPPSSQPPRAITSATSGIGRSCATTRKTSPSCTLASVAVSDAQAAAQTPPSRNSQ